VFQLVFPLHECADPAATKSAIAESIAEPPHSVSNFAATESAVEPLQFVADSTATGAAPTETS
jgi:hypothetical protein